MGSLNDPQDPREEEGWPSQAECPAPEGEDPSGLPSYLSVDQEEDMDGQTANWEAPPEPPSEGAGDVPVGETDDYDPTKDETPPRRVSVGRAPADPFHYGEAGGDEDPFDQGGPSASREPRPGEGRGLQNRLEHLLGRPATTEEREVLWRYRARMDLPDDDPVWDDYLVMVQHEAAMERHGEAMARHLRHMEEQGDHHVQRIEAAGTDLKADLTRRERETVARMPEMVRKGIQQGLDDRMAKDLAKSVDRLASRKATVNTFQVFVAAVLAILLAGGGGYWLGQRHLADKLTGAEKWLNSEQGQFAQRLAELNPEVLEGYQKCRWKGNGQIYKGEIRRANGEVLCYSKAKDGTVVPLTIARN